MVKIIILAVVGVFFIVLLKEQKTSLAFLLMLAICMILMFSIFDYGGVLMEGLEVLEAYFDSSGYYIKLIMKMDKEMEMIMNEKRKRRRKLCK